MKSFAKALRKISSFPTFLLKIVQYGHIIPTPLYDPPPPVYDPQGGSQDPEGGSCNGVSGNSSVVGDGIRTIICIIFALMTSSLSRRAVIGLEVEIRL